MPIGFLHSHRRTEQLDGITNVNPRHINSLMIPRLIGQRGPIKDITTQSPVGHQRIHSLREALSMVAFMHFKLTPGPHDRCGRTV